MRIMLALSVVLLCVMHTSGAVQIVEFCPDPYLHEDADEYIVLSGNGTLDDISLSDNHGGFRFPPGTVIRGYVTVARNAVAYNQTHGRYPDFEWLDYSPDVPNVINGDPLRLANTRDELVLYKNNNAVQSVSWPEDVRPREGQVHYLENGTWDRRVLLIGQSRFEPAVFHNASVTTFVSPDCAGEVFRQVLDNASASAYVNMYEFSSSFLGESLVAAKTRGVDVRVLIEGGPVGGISPAEKSLVWTVNRSGIPVMSMVSTATDHAPYRYDHAKYIVIDNTSILVTSENFKNSGLPPKGMSGNRGWGVHIRNSGLAHYFTGIFFTDIGSRSVVPYSGTAGKAEPALSEKYPAEFTPAIFEGATVIPVIAPDTSYQITEMLDRARSSIEIEQAYIKNESRLTLNPYLSSAINASRRGVHVRILLDSYWYNVEGPGNNDEMAVLINRIAAAEHLPLEAKCIDLSISPVEKIHNKGIIVDDERVLVSSINWNSNSPVFNREAGVIIDHPGAARYFRAVFDDDWNPVANNKKPAPDYVRIAVGILVLLFLFAVYIRRQIL
ncbi:MULTISPECIES: phosphatidylserine/phosphatidylglycerophosphate/cardiolipin synthase family protein [unclassified Methanoregula]|uniref:phospholipase D-like domain-containing protein n=1 Tax=unclassified Methanoregula TaxID=2649730 RepID=UPI0009D56FE9|nr:MULTISPECIES: phospholipase D-like domain-containing protein [unclassified Methanoregula]OPX61644.1 MAG: cardiolipin synthetase [Methanoregula sp. PtaB.Bin085]OPY34047.1 MAG: cardiolipin synthetase [Methanoregula sp. PtaU1.Bin006]